MWIVSSFSFVNKPPDDIKDTPIYDNTRPPKPGRYESTYLNAILRDCGQLCNTSRKGLPGPYFDRVTAPIECMALFENDYIDLGHGKPVAPKDFPPELMDGYTMGGRIRLEKVYYNNLYLGRTNSIPVWTVKDVDNMIQSAKHGKLGGTYGAKDTNELCDALKHTPGIKDGRVLVIGSTNPWVEACV